MNMENFPDDSDSSDEDYVPDGKEDAVSELDSDGELIDTLEEPETAKNGEGKSKKRKKKTTNLKKKIRKKEDQDEEEVVSKKEEEKVESVENKQAVDDLWADFIKDTGFKSKNSKAESSSKPSEASKNVPNSATEKSNGAETANSSEKPKEKVKITQVFEFAGEEVKVEKEVDSNSTEARLLLNDAPKSSRPRKSGGLSGIGNVLSQLGKKQKISTLEKSKLDWDRFKKEENIEEELQTYNKGKDGYLDRQDFLQRADLRRFEIEKNMRNTERAKRFNSTL